MEVPAIRKHKLQFVSLFYLDIFIHSSSMQALIIKRKEVMERRAKMHSTHCLKISFSIWCKIAIENRFLKLNFFNKWIFNRNFTAMNENVQVKKWHKMQFLLFYGGDLHIPGESTRKPHPLCMFLALSLRIYYLDLRNLCWNNNIFLWKIQKI